MSSDEAQSSQSQASSGQDDSSDSGSDPDFYVADSLPNTAYGDDPILEDGQENEQQAAEERDEDGLDPEILEARLENQVPVNEW